MAFLRTLISQLILRERLKTTEARAKETAPLAEKLVTIAKGGTPHSRRVLHARLSEAAAAKLAGEIAPRFGARRGGYTRIVKLPPRKSDGARMAIVEFVK